MLSERWFYQARVTQRLERDFVLQDEGWSATPSARSASLDDVDGGPDGRVYIQMRGIEQVRIFRALQGRGGPAGVESKVIRDEDNDQWKLRVRRVTVPVVLEPAAAWKIAGL